MRPEAVAAMLPFLSDHPGNPSGGHAVARVAKTALEEAREEVAAILGCAPGEVVFTGGGTEADNLAVKGGARAQRAAGRDGVVTSAIEHKGVLAAAKRLGTEGFRVATVGVDSGGVLDLDQLEAVVDDRTAVVSVMLVNNEVGTIQPLAEVARAGRGLAPRGAAPHRRGPGGAVARRGRAGRRLRPRRRSRATSSAGRRASACSWSATA